VSIVDEHAFGDLKSFREQFASLSQARVFAQLKARLAPLCHRTLRRQVTAYVPFTKRHAMVEEFTPAESEDQLYELVPRYLRRRNLQALPASQLVLPVVRLHLHLRVHEACNLPARACHRRRLRQGSGSTAPSTRSFAMAPV